jgi:hypothetical protein
MGSTNDIGANFAVYRFEHGQQVVATGSDIASWAGATTSVVGFLVAAYDFFENTFNKKPDSVYAKLDNIALALGLDKVSEVSNALHDQASTIDTAWGHFLTFSDTESAPNRQLVQQSYHDITDALSHVLLGEQYRLIPSVYPSAPWRDGRWVPGLFFTPADPTTTTNLVFQEYEQGESTAFPNGQALAGLFSPRRDRVAGQ